MQLEIAQTCEFRASSILPLIMDKQLENERRTTTVTSTTRVWGLGLGYTKPQAPNRKPWDLGRRLPGSGLCVAR